MKETLVGCVGFRRSQPNLQIPAPRLSSLEEARGNERAIAHVSGIVESNVNFDLELATVGYDRQATTAEVIIQAATTAGYQATSIDSLGRNLSTSVETSLVLQRSPVHEPNHAIELLMAIHTIDINQDRPKPIFCLYL